MKRDGTKAKYELIEYDGHNEKYQGKMVRLYEDGCIRDERGWMIEKHPSGKEITQENSRIYRELHYQQMQEAALSTNTAIAFTQQKVRRRFDLDSDSSAMTPAFVCRHGNQFSPVLIQTTVRLFAGIA